MSKRIVKETLSNGQERYRVENDTILGIPTPFWFGETVILWRDGTVVTTEAVFDTYDRAMDCINADPKLIKKEIVYKN